MNEVLHRSVEGLELSFRSYNCLKNANIASIGGLGLSFDMKFDSQGRLIACERPAGECRHAGFERIRRGDEA